MLSKLSRLSRSSFGLALAGTFVLAPIAPVYAAPAIVPHQAIYLMSLGSRTVSADVNDVQGLMYFRWSDACEGWEVQQRYVMEFVYSEGESLELSSSYETWEAKDQSAFNFSYRTETNGQEDKDIQGVATVSPGEEGEARYRLPDRTTAELPEGTYFPTGHTVELLRNAVGGPNFFTVDLFEGTEVESAIELSAIIGAAETAEEPEVQSDDLGADSPLVSPLTHVRSWPVSLAFFSTDLQQAEPDYQMSMRLFENGVVDEFEIDYGDFVVNGSLARIEEVTDGGC